MKPIAYEGKEPYIFISYAHKDSERVFQVLDELDKKGYRIWYDDGIAPGSEWPEDIARHLDGAQMVIAFITANSMASINCRREINFALSKEKHFLSILLERTDMPLGMEMQLSAQQSILRYNYTTWEAFIDKILKCPDIVPCKRPEPKPVEPVVQQPVYQAPQQAVQTPQAPVYQTPQQVFYQAPAQAPVQQQPYQAPAAQNANPVPMAQQNVYQPPQTSVQALPAAPDKPVKQQKVKAPKEKKAGAPSSSTKKIILFGSIGLVSIACIVLMIVLLSGSSFKTSWGVKVKRTDGYLVYIGKEITQADLKNISKMTKITSLTLSDCDFSSCDFSSVTLPKTLTKLNFENATGINDYSFLNALTLEELNINGASSFAALGSLDLSKMKRLSLNNTSIENLAPLKDSIELTELYIAGTKVDDISVVSSFSKLYKLDISYTKVTTLAPIKDLKELVQLDISGCPLTEIPDELMCIKLTEFKAADSGLKNLDLIKNCTKLTTLDVSKNSSLDSLGDVIDQNKDTLTYIDLSLTALRYEEVYSAGINNCANLKELRVNGLELLNLDFCQNLSKLETLYAIGCELIDISGLKNCTSLVSIHLAINEIDDVSALSNLTLNGTTKLDLSFNSLSDVSALPGGKYRVLLLHGNRPEMVNTISTECSATIITCEYDESITSSALSNSGNYNVIYVTETPTNQILALEEALGKYTVKIVTYDELMEGLMNDSLEYSIGFRYDYPYSLYQELK